MDDPIVRSMEKTGYPPWIDDYEEYRCPVCGRECEGVYMDSVNVILGCEHCLKKISAEEMLIREKEALQNPNW